MPDDECVNCANKRPGVAASNQSEDKEAYER